jgi:hypothetical protein
MAMRKVHPIHAVAIEIGEQIAFLHHISLTN